jgi:hypothetical protein
MKTIVLKTWKGSLKINKLIHRHLYSPTHYRNRIVIMPMRNTSYMFVRE